MENEILYTSNFLNGLFTDKDFKFITNSDKEIEEIKKNIFNQESKRDAIVEYITNLNDIIAVSKDEVNLKDLLSSGTKIFELINESINSLYGLKRQLNEIIKSTVDLLVSIETTKKDKSFYSDIINSIENKIKLFSEKIKKVSDKISYINTQYESFINKEINIPYTTMIDKNTMLLKDSNISNTKNSNISSSQTLINIPDNKTLRITEDYVYLPYKCSEINDYIKKYPNEYSCAEDVIKKEFTFPRKYYIKHSVLSRFRETYALIRDREVKSIPEAIKYAFELMFRYEINPAIIAACKTQEDLEDYLNCLETNKLNDFNRFKIKFEINPF